MRYGMMTAGGQVRNTAGGKVGKTGQTDRQAGSSIFAKTDAEGIYVRAPPIPSFSVGLPSALTKAWWTSPDLPQMPMSSVYVTSFGFTPQECIIDRIFSAWSQSLQTLP